MSAGVDEIRPRVRVFLVMTYAGRVLLERRAGSDGLVEHTIPSADVFAGQSVKAAAHGLAGRVLDGTWSDLRFQSVVVAPASAGEGSRVILALGAEASADPAGPPTVREERWRFVALDALGAPLAEDAALVLRAAREKAPLVDLDGEVLAAGDAAPSPTVEAEEPSIVAALRPPSNGRLMLTAGMLFAGAGAWTTGVLVGAQQAYRFDEDVVVTAVLLAGLVLMVASVRLAFAGWPAEGVAERFARTAGAIVAGFASAGALLMVAVWFGGGGDARVAFWLFFFGMVTVALGLGLVRGARHVKLSPASPRIAVFATLALSSFVVVFPPLREGLAERFSSSGGDGEEREEAEILFPEEDQ